MTRTPLTRELLDEVTILGRDEVGVVAESSGFRYYLTDCCGASATGTEGGVACRSCYNYIDDSLGGCPETDQTSRWYLPLLEVYGDGIPWTVWADRAGIKYEVAS